MSNIQTAINNIKTAKENLRVAINGKGRNISETAKLSTYAAEVNAISTTVSISRTIFNNSGQVTSRYQDFTIPADTTLAYIVVDSIYVGNDNTISCTRQSGSSVTITTKISTNNYNFDAYGVSPVRLRTITYQVTKAKGSSSVVRVTVSNPYGLAGACFHLVTNS